MPCLCLMEANWYYGLFNSNTISGKWSENLVILKCVVWYSHAELSKPYPCCE